MRINIIILCLILLSGCISSRELAVSNDNYSEDTANETVRYLQSKKYKLLAVFFNNDSFNLVKKYILTDHLLSKVLEHNIYLVVIYPDEKNFSDDKLLFQKQLDDISSTLKNKGYEKKMYISTIACNCNSAMVLFFIK